MPDKNNLGFFVLVCDVLSGLSPMIEMEINFYHVFINCVTFWSNIKIFHECFSYLVRT